MNTTGFNRQKRDATIHIVIYIVCWSWPEFIASQIRDPIICTTIRDPYVQLLQNFYCHPKRILLCTIILWTLDCTSERRRSSLYNQRWRIILNMFRLNFASPPRFSRNNAKKQQSELPPPHSNKISHWHTLYQIYRHNIYAAIYTLLKLTLKSALQIHLQTGGH